MISGQILLFQSISKNTFFTFFFGILVQLEIHNAEDNNLDKLNLVLPRKLRAILYLLV